MPPRRRYTQNSAALMVFSTFAVCACVPMVQAWMDAPSLEGIRLTSARAWVYEPCTQAPLLLSFADRDVACGGSVSFANAAAHAPLVAFAGAGEHSLYSLAAVQLDSSGHQHRHWLLGHISGPELRTGNMSRVQVLTRWQPFPPPSGLALGHRYDFLLFSEDGLVTQFEDVPPEDTQWNARKWADNYGFGPPIASTAIYIRL